MKIIKKCTVLLLFLLLILGCASCHKQTVQETTISTQTEETSTYAYTEEYRRCMEQYGTEFIFNGNVLLTCVNGRSYEFDPKLSEEERTAFIAAQELLCNYLMQHDISTEGLTLRIVSGYINRSESENKIAYFNVSTLESWEQVLTTLQATLGDFTNYGYLYALSQHVSEELLWQRDALTLENAQMFETRPTLLNLVYPCFNETYTNAKEINACKALAVQLLSQMETPFAGEKEFLFQIQDYAVQLGVDFAPTYITFAYNGESCPLRFCTEYLDIFRDREFESSREYQLGQIEEDYLTNLDTIVRTFEWLDVQITDLKTLFPIGEVPLIPVILKENLKKNHDVTYGALFYYTETESYIHARSLTALAHEYVHYLFWLCDGHEDAKSESWHTEAVAYYFTLGHRFEGRLNSAEHLRLAEKLLGEEYDALSDEIIFARKAFRENENPAYQYHLKTLHVLCSCFGEYFVRTYGEENFLNSMLKASKVEEYTGKTMGEIVADWCVDMADESKDALVKATFG